MKEFFNHLILLHYMQKNRAYLAYDDEIYAYTVRMVFIMKDNSTIKAFFPVIYIKI